MTLPILVISSGQSNNMSGPGSEGGDQTVNPNVKAWSPTAGDWVTAELGQEPFIVGDTPPRNNLPWNFCKQLQETEQRDVYLVLSGKGATPISAWEAPIGTEWIKLNTAALAALASPEMAGKTAPDYFTWFQGEADTANENYEAEFLALRDNAISAGWMTKHTPVIAGEILHVTAKSKDALLNILADRSATWFNLAPNEGMERYGTGPHFTAQGYIDYGRGPFYAATKQLPRLPSPYFREWTPELVGTTTNPTVTYDTAETYGGSYRVGNVVNVWFKIKLTSLSGGAGYPAINGLPYPINPSIPASGAYCQTGIASDVSGVVSPCGFIILKSAGNSGIKLLRSLDAGTTPLLFSKLTGDFTMTGSLTYFVN